jgi:hypothetical protein
MPGRTELARHIALLRQADADDLTALRDQLRARCYPPRSAGARLNPRALVWIEDDPQDNRVLVALCERLWPTTTSQDQ